MKYIKTKCVCCPDAVSLFRGRVLLLISNWRNIDLYASYNVDWLPTYSAETDRYIKVEYIHRLRLSVWMLSLEVSHRYERAVDLPAHEYDTLELSLGRRGDIMITPPAPWQKNPAFGGLGGGAQLHFVGFSADCDYDTNIYTEASFALPYLGSVNGYYMWYPESRRTKGEAK